MERKIMLQWINEGTISIPAMLIQHYTKIGLKDSEVMLLIHVYSFIQKDIGFPTPEELANRMSHSEKECLEMLRSLMKRGFLELEEQKNENQIFSETFSLSPLWDKLIALSYQEKEESKELKKETDEKMIYQLFETEFGRPLSPMECELITMWLDQDDYNPSLIKAALMESVVSGKRNLRYIDRILIEWHKNGVRTVQQAKDYGEKFRSHQYKATPKDANEPKKKFPSYNWLKD